MLPSESGTVNTATGDPSIAAIWREWRHLRQVTVESKFRIGRHLLVYCRDHGDARRRLIAEFGKGLYVLFRSYAAVARRWPAEDLVGENAIGRRGWRYYRDVRPGAERVVRERPEIELFACKVAENDEMVTYRAEDVSGRVYLIRVRAAG